MKWSMLFPVADVAVGPVIAVGTAMIVLIIAVIVVAVVLLVKAIKRKRSEGK